MVASELYLRGCNLLRGRAGPDRPGRPARGPDRPQGQEDHAHPGGPRRSQQTRRSDRVLRLPAARRDDMRRFAEILGEEKRTRLVEALAPILTRPEIRALTIGPGC